MIVFSSKTRPLRYTVMGKWPKAPLEFIGTFHIFMIWSTDDSAGAICLSGAQSSFGVVRSCLPSSSVAGEVMLAGWFLYLGACLQSQLRAA